MALNKKAFTLAETMVTLTIVGILAAILIPAITKISPDSNKVMFRKAYYTLQRAVSMMINDDYSYPSGQAGVDAATAVVQRGFNYTTNTSATTSYNKFAYLLSDILDTVGTISVASNNSSDPSYFMTADGITWNIYPGNSDDHAGTPYSVTTYGPSYEWPLKSDLYNTKIMIDVNGAKNPNCSNDSSAYNVAYGNSTTYYYAYSGSAWAANVFDTSSTCSDPDRFIIGVRYDGKLQVGCTSDIGSACSSTTDSTALSILSAPSNNIK